MTSENIKTDLPIIGCSKFEHSAASSAIPYCVRCGKPYELRRCRVVLDDGAPFEALCYYCSRCGIWFEDEETRKRYSISLI